MQLGPLHEDLTFVAPLLDARAEHLVGLFGDLPVGRIVDFGCGWGELLMRAVIAAPGTSGLGLDLDEEALAHGRELVAARGLGERVTLTAGDAKTVDRPVDAASCVGSSQVFGEPHVAALAALRAMVVPGSPVLYAPSHPQTAWVLQLADTHRSRWLAGYRGYLGFGYLSLVAR